jgi:ribose 5-phosphate isomerase A
MNASVIEEAKKKAACAAVDEYIHDGMTVGIGSGSTVVYAVQHLAERIHSKKWHVICIPTSYQARQLIIDNNLTLGTLDQYSIIDIDIDGADEVDPDLNLIKGGGGCHTQEKIVATCAKKMIIIVDYRKRSKQLGTVWRGGIPIEIIPSAYKSLMLQLQGMGGTAKLRMGTTKMGPVLSDNGNFLVDVDFGPISQPDKLHQQLKLLVGVIETGLFVQMAEKVFFGESDGSISTLSRTKK